MLSNCIITLPFLMIVLRKSHMKSYHSTYNCKKGNVSQHLAIYQLLLVVTSIPPTFPRYHPLLTPPQLRQQFVYVAGQNCYNMLHFIGSPTTVSFYCSISLALFSDAFFHCSISSALLSATTFKCSISSAFFTASPLLVLAQKPYFLRHKIVESILDVDISWYTVEIASKNIVGNREK